MDLFLSLFGEHIITIQDIFLVVLACVGFYSVPYKKMWKPYYKNQQEKERQINDLISKVETIDTLSSKADQSLTSRLDKVVISINNLTASQKQLHETQKEMKKFQEELHSSIEDLKEKTRKYELSDSRNELIKMYRYYGDRSRNPKHAWTDMEKHAFTEALESYESNGGNDYIHSTVKPEMESLDVVYITDHQGVADLYTSRSRAATGKHTNEEER